MFNKTSSINGIGWLLMGVLWCCKPVEPPEAEFLQYPDTKKGEVTDDYFGIAVPDPYRWLENGDSEDTKNWIADQNEVTHDFLSKIPYREKIKQRLTELWDYERYGIPTEHGQYLYYFHNDGLQNQSVLYRESPDGQQQVFIDPNQFSTDGTIALMTTSFSKDGSLMTYLISEGGADWRKAITVSTSLGEVIGDTLKNIKFGRIAWNGNDGFFYCSYDQPGGSVLSAKTEHHKLYYHKLGTPQTDDQRIFGGEREPYRYISAYTTEDERYLVIEAAQRTDGNELLLLDLTNPRATPMRVVDNTRNNHSVIDYHQGRFLLFTDLDAPNGKLVSFSLDNSSPENWKDIIPEKDQPLSITTAGGKLFARYLIDAKTSFQMYDREGGLLDTIELPGSGTASGFRGNTESKVTYFGFTSFTDPYSVYRYDIEKNTTEPFRQPSVKFDPDAFVTKQVFYPSKDGTEIPMFIVHKKDLELTGDVPTYLYGYGGFNISLTPRFSTQLIVWLENGGIYAVPSLRGGGEYGKDWHRAGTKMNKQNVFDDFIAAGEYLIKEGYTSPDRLAIAGGSNGGLLVGATMTQRPDLAAVAFPAVGVMDMLRYHKFTAGAGWAYDYGTAEDSKEMFQYLLDYSPLHALTTGVDYPATLVTTADHDDRVVPAHSFKFAATLQDAHSGIDPVLIRIDHNAGHGAGTPTAMRISKAADTYAFAWYNMNIIPELAAPEK